MTFYNPFLLQIGEIPAIVYPSKELEKVMDRKQLLGISNHLLGLYDRNDSLRHPVIGKPNYNIDVVWEDEGDVMTDVWIFARLGEWSSGPLVDVETFRSMKLETKMGKGCGNSLGMLGREDDLLAASSYDLSSYLASPREELLPERLRVGENFEMSS